MVVGTLITAPETLCKVVGGLITTTVNRVAGVINRMDHLATLDAMDHFRIALLGQLDFIKRRG